MSQLCRKIATDDFGKGRDVGFDVVILLSSARSDPKTGHHLVEDQQHSVLFGDLAQPLQIPLHGRNDATVGQGRLDQT